MEIGVAEPIFTHKNIKGSMVQQYPYPKRWEQNSVAIIHIYGARAILLLFYDNQETESETCEIEVGVAGPISTKKIPKALWYNNIQTPQGGRKI